MGGKNMDLIETILVKNVKRDFQKIVEKGNSLNKYYHLIKQTQQQK